MYKSCVMRRPDSSIDLVWNTYKDVCAYLCSDTILGFDGMQWIPYLLLYNSTTNTSSWAEVKRATCNPNTFGDMVIQKIIETGSLVVIQDFTEDEFEVQRALGTCLSGPIKICVQPEYRDRILQLMAL